MDGQVIAGEYEDFLVAKMWGRDEVLFKGKRTVQKNKLFGGTKEIIEKHEFFLNKGNAKTLISSYEVVGEQSADKLAGALTGGILLGPLGAIVGALGASNKTRLIIFWKDDKQSLIEVNDHTLLMKWMF